MGSLFFNGQLSPQSKEIDMLVYESEKRIKMTVASHPSVKSGWYGRYWEDGIPSIRRLAGPEEGLIRIPVFFREDGGNWEYRIMKEELVWYDQWEGEWKDRGEYSWHHKDGSDWKRVRSIKKWQRIEKKAQKLGIGIWNDTRLEAGWVATVPLINEHGSHFGYSVRNLEGPEDDLYIVEVEGVELQERLSLVSPLAWEINLMRERWGDGWIERNDLWSQIRGHGKECRIK